MHQAFLDAIHTRRKVRLTFYSREDGAPLTRLCAPMDYGPSRRARLKNNRYHLWDYESDTRNHVLSLNPEQITSMSVVEDCFEPAEFVTWSTRTSQWSVKRDWGPHS